MNNQMNLLRRFSDIRPRTANAGVTVIEVLFAIGVILIGLLGVVAIIPVAGRDAGEAIRIDTAGRMANAISDELIGRNVGSLDGLVFADIDAINDDFYQTNQVLNMTPLPTPTEYSFITAPNQAPQRELRRLLDRPALATALPPNPPAPLIAKGLDSPGLMFAFRGDTATAAATYRTTRMASFCIDPDFLAKNATPLLGAPPAVRNAYQSGRYPYYSEWYNPVNPPSAALSGVGSTPPHPRMYRVGAGQLGSYVSGRIADALTHADGSLMLHRPKDRSLAPSQVVTNIDAAGASVGSRTSGGRYTWIATVTPPLDGSNHYNMTVVVIESRESFAGLYDPTTAPAIPSDKTNPISERVCWVTNPVQLGSTIEVSAYGSDNVDATIRPGQWVMLSRQVYETVGNVPAGDPIRPHSRLPAVHRWYRVLRVLDRETGPFVQAPFPSLTGCWRRQVVLEGPSWQFGTDNNGNGSAATTLLADDTYMTIVHGAVAIKESTIELEF